MFVKLDDRTLDDSLDGAFVEPCDNLQVVRACIGRHWDDGGFEGGRVGPVEYQFTLILWASAPFDFDPEFTLDVVEGCHRHAEFNRFVSTGD